MEQLYHCWFHFFSMVLEGKKKVHLTNKGFQMSSVAPVNGVCFAPRTWWILASLCGLFLLGESSAPNYKKHHQIWYPTVQAVHQTITLAIALLALPGCSWGNIGQFIVVNITIEYAVLQFVSK